MQTLIINIKELFQIREIGIDKVSGSAMAILPSIANAYLVLENDLIKDYGEMKDCPEINPEKIINL